MRAEVICIGDELLIGQTINTNAAWMGQQLALIGVQVHRSITIADRADDIIETLHESLGRVPLVLITGGLGPTRDDVTKDALCQYFGTRLVWYPEIEKQLAEYFANRDLTLNEMNRTMALLPEACTLLPNTRGTASGMWFEKEGKVVVSMPGVPHEMKGLMTEWVLDKIKTHFNCPVIVHRTVLTFGVGETVLAEKIAAWEDSLAAEGMSLAYLPSAGEVKLRLTATGTDGAEITSRAEKKLKDLLPLISEYVYGFGTETLASVAGRQLAERGETLALAESCTGGLIGHLVTGVPGSSRYFIGAVTTYHERIKQLILGVEQGLIEQYGVVSSQVACAMAEGARQKLRSTWALSTTGIAGPSGGTETTPVGTIWIALAGPAGVKSHLLKLGKSRERNILIAANSALFMLFKELNGPDVENG